MNRVDIVLLVVLALYAFLGYRRGFLALALDWLGLVAAVTLALWLTPTAGEWLTRSYGLVTVIARVLAFLGLLLVARLAWSIVVFLVWRRVPRRLRESPVNRAAGIVPGLLQGALIGGLALVALAALPLPLVPKGEIADSVLGALLLKWGATAQAEAQHLMGGSVRELITFRRVPLREDERIDLPFRSDEAATDPEAEVAMLPLLNAERRKRGLPALRMNERLRQVGRRHSGDMLARGYFAHVDPNGRDPFDRLRSAGIGYLAAGENLAFAPSVTTAHEGLMNSPGHRANILNPAFRRVGIGVLHAPPYGRMFTQVFTN